MSVLKPEMKVALASGEVTVRELRAIEALQLFKLITAHLGKLTNEKGELQLDLSRLVELISGTEELARFVANSTTGKDDAWFNELSVTELLVVLDAAAELNLSEGILKNAGRLGDRLQTIFGQKMPKIATLKSPSPAPSTSS